MLSIVKLRVGQEAYQLTGVAQSLDDYYTGAGEAPGEWAGVGAERLGLSGEVNGQDLRAVLAGIAPGTGGLSPNGEEIRPHASAEDRPEMLRIAADQWIGARLDGTSPVLLAGTNETVDALNRTVRHALIERGLLDGDVIAEFAGRGFLEGDRVVLRRNSHDEHTTAGVEVTVLNGQVGTVVGGSAEHLDVCLDRSHDTVRLRGDYLHAGYVDHGYALTPHRAQGGTWDLAIAVGLDGLYREAAYVQMSRGSETNLPYATPTPRRIQIPNTRSSAPVTRVPAIASV